MEKQFEPIIEHLKQELSNIHVGRTSPGMLDGVMITAYGTNTEINQLASITSQDAQTLLIQPWDVSVLKDIEKGLRDAQRDFNPAVDGTVIRLSFPPLTEEKRKEYVKRMYEICEKSHISIKKIREDIMNNLKKLKQNSEISEDVFFSDQKKVQQLVDDNNAKIEAIAKDKETDIMTI